MPRSHQMAFGHMTRGSSWIAAGRGRSHQTDFRAWFALRCSRSRFPAVHQGQRAGTTDERRDRGEVLADVTGEVEHGDLVRGTHGHRGRRVAIHHPSERLCARRPACARSPCPRMLVALVSETMSDYGTAGRAHSLAVSGFGTIPRMRCERLSARGAPGATSHPDLRKSGGYRRRR